MNSIVPFFRKLRRKAFEPALVKRSIIISLVVGAILVTINQGEIIREGKEGWTTALQIMLTLLVPYTVSTVSGVLADCDESE